MMKLTKFKKLFVHTVAFACIALVYQNCGSPDSNPGFYYGASGNSDEIVALPNTKTTSVVRGSRVLDTLVSCLGTEKSSQAAKNVLNASIGTISTEGLANSLNQPMVKTIVSLSAEVCNDLYNLERNQTDADRKIFVGVDFTDGGFDGVPLILAAKRLSRSCWGKNISDDELSDVVSDVQTQFAEGTDNGAKTKSKMIYLCTAMASSFATYEM